jgi:hypothetical protein
MKKVPANSTKACLMCQRSGHAKMTKEHVWPQWLGTVVGHGEDGEKVDTHVHQNAPSGRKERTWTGAGPTNLTINDVCSVCNNGWLSELENHVKPFLSVMAPGLRQLSVSADELRWLGRWAVKTSMVLEATRPVQERFFSGRDRLEFLEHFGLSRVSVQIAVAANYCPGPRIGTLYSRWPIPMRAIGRPDIMTQSICLSTTIVIWRVALQVFATRVRDDGFVSIKRPAFQREAADITTPKRTLLWPPSDVLRGEEIFDFAERFQVATGRGPASTALWHSIRQVREQRDE